MSRSLVDRTAVMRRSATLLPSFVLGSILAITYGALLATTASAQQIHIRIINAKTNQPITNESLNLTLSGPNNSVPLATTTSDIITVDTNHAITVRVHANSYTDCRSPGEADTDYSIATILQTGLTASNLCNTFTRYPKPGELILFETPKDNVPIGAQLPPQLRIRIFNAKTNKPITDERLNVALRADQIGSVAMATDKNGLILVRPGAATTIRILANMYGDCRPRAELYTDYPIATILSTGITTTNICSGISLPPKAGELLLFEIPKNYIPTFPAPPASNLPHSDAPPTSY